MPTYNLTRWPKIHRVILNKWQAPFTNEDIMKTGNPAMINIVRKIMMCVRRLRTHIRRFRTHIRKLLTENMKMKNQQRGFKRWLLRKKCREPFTLHSSNLLNPNGLCGNSEGWRVSWNILLSEIYWQRIGGWDTSPPIKKWVYGCCNIIQKTGKLFCGNKLIH